MIANPRLANAQARCQVRETLHLSQSRLLQHLARSASNTHTRPPLHVSLSTASRPRMPARSPYPYRLLPPPCPTSPRAPCLVLSIILAKFTRPSTRCLLAASDCSIGTFLASVRSRCGGGSLAFGSCADSNGRRSTWANAVESRLLAPTTKPGRAGSLVVRWLP